MSYIFPISFMANTYAITVLLILLGLAGKSDMASEIGVIQGAMLALYYAFSANARSLILNQASTVSAQSVMASRLVLLIPLAGFSYLLSVSAASVEQTVAIAIILRRSVEWLGEVHLSDMERTANKIFARNYFVMQAILLALVVVWILTGSSYSLVGLLIWALAPLLLSAKYIWKTLLVIPKVIGKLSSSILPHLGSTAIIGATVYVFRLLILFVLGKSVSGDLFTAFAIGGMTGGVFATVLGPSLALYEQRIGKKHFPAKLRIILGCSLIVGAFLFIVSFLSLPLLDWTRKSHFFWMATGLSMIGGVIMVFAQQIRLRLLQHDEEHDVFGPDVMMNILLIAAVPFGYYLLGHSYMTGLYLLSAILAFVFYLSSKEGQHLQKSLKKLNKIRMVIAGLLLFPMFIQFNNGIFQSPVMSYSVGGNISLLPIPVSVLACFAGIILLGAYQRCFVAFVVIFFTFLLMMIATIISTGASPLHQESKLILLIQFILPMFGLALGQMYNKIGGVDDHRFEKMFLYILLLIVPMQLASTWLHGSLYLLPSLGIFSIYQHLQYVPVIFISAYLVALFSLWEHSKYRNLLLILSPMIAIYVAASMSMLAIGMFLIGFLLLVIVQKVYGLGKITLIFLLLVGLSASYLQYLRYHSGDVDKFDFVTNLEAKLQKKHDILLIQSKKEVEIFNEIKLQSDIRERVNYWSYYYNIIIEKPQNLLIGNGKMLDHSKYPSAYNYYLDLIFNFGLLSMLPLLGLLIYTSASAFKAREKVLATSGLLGLCMVTFFLLVFDNSLKVSLRQPYSGFFTFFLWGVLISKVGGKKLKAKNVIYN